MGNVVITGGSRGIGAATVELFAARGVTPENGKVYRSLRP